MVVWEALVGITTPLVLISATERHEDAQDIKEQGCD